jgi:hypothetical protein
MAAIRDTQRVRARFAIGLVVCLLAAFAVRKLVVPATDAPYKGTYAMAWYGCTSRGECLPSFYPIASGRALLLRCSGSGRCALSSYLEWDLADERGFTWHSAPAKRSAEARVASRGH